MSSIRKSTMSTSSMYGSRAMKSSRSITSIDYDTIYNAMAKGHSVIKIVLLKNRDREQKLLTLNMETRQICLTKPGSPPMTLDLRYVKEAHTLDHKLVNMKIQDKWTKDKDIRVAHPIHILVIAHGHTFNLSYWILYFNDMGEAAQMWAQGINNIVMDTLHAPHPLIISRWMKKQYNTISQSSNNVITMKHMKPFAQTTLQCKVQSKFLQELMKDNMTFADFEAATRALVHNNSPIFASFFRLLSDDGLSVTFPNFRRFLKEMQQDDMHNSRERTIEFLRKYLADPTIRHQLVEPSLTITQFLDFLFSRENSIWDPVNDKVVHQMDRPLSHYWIASSHNTYLTGDQLRSESSLDSYARALMMGCRCIELDCWDGMRKSNSQEVVDIVIYHGYTMTSKLQLRDVLFTIKHYAFMNSDYPVILSIEDNCSVAAQRILAHDIKEILGDFLLTQPVRRDETEIPSPMAMKRKIIIKHKKLALENEELPHSTPALDEIGDTELLEKECVKKGILHLKNPTTNEWTPHVFVLFHDRLCYTNEVYSGDSESKSDDTISMSGDDDSAPEELLSGFGVRPEEMHVTEEWFHGKCDRQVAVSRLMEQPDKKNGMFLVRDSTIFIGDYSLSFIHDGKVYHCRIKTKMNGGEKKYYFLEHLEMDTLYELICHYMKKTLSTPLFSTTLIQACPQPQPHLNQPWFSATATKESAEELLSKVPEDGAFLVRYSSTDDQVFVLSVKLEGAYWHFRLKRNGRIFVVNQTVFENLNQIVDYYSTREFARGTSLKFPVNEKDVDKYANSVGEAAPGCYMDIATFDKPTQARSLRPFHGASDEQLSFPANAFITIIKKEAHLWRGKYDGKTGWFNPAFVQEITNGDGKDGKDFRTIDLTGTLVEKIEYDKVSDRPNVLRISQASQHWTGQQWHISTQTPEEADDWHNELFEILRSTNEKVSNLRTKEKNARIAAELSNLVVYCQAVPFNPDKVGTGSFYEMCSFSESKLDKILDKGLVTFNSRQMSRVYPQGSRITSANFNPVPMWNAGCHMVALNYQTSDKPMQLNNGKFLANGRCGYVLKPSYMLDDAFDPLQGNKVSTSTPILLTLRVIAGRHLSRKDKNKGICSPYVEVELCGLPCDDKSFRTNTITSNGLNPQWNEQFVFQVHCPELVLIRFLVEDGDFVGPKTDPFIGQAVFPLDSIRTGYRSVPLRNQYSEELELSSLLVYIDMAPLTASDKVQKSAHALLQANRSIYASIARSPSISAYSPPPFQKAPSIEQKLISSRNSSLDVPPSNEAPPTPRERNHSTDDDSISSSSSSKKKNGKPIFKKIFSFGSRKDSN